MRLRIRKKGKTPSKTPASHTPTPRGGQPDFTYPPGGTQNAGADGLPGSAGYRGGPKDKPPGGFLFQPPPPDPPKHPKKPWE